MAWPSLNLDAGGACPPALSKLEKCSQASHHSRGVVWLALLRTTSQYIQGCVDDHDRSQQLDVVRAGQGEIMTVTAC
jgi:hypothetical protein